MMRNFIRLDAGALCAVDLQHDGHQIEKTSYRGGPLEEVEELGAFIYLHTLSSRQFVQLWDSQESKDVSLAGEQNRRV